ncbi:MAG TPA: hypothetical protein VIT92_00490 [Burkholderiaceae bacterium]
MAPDLRHNSSRSTPAGLCYELGGVLLLWLLVAQQSSGDGQTTWPAAAYAAFGLLYALSTASSLRRLRAGAAADRKALALQRYAGLAGLGPLAGIVRDRIVASALAGGIAMLLVQLAAHDRFGPFGQTVVYGAAGLALLAGTCWGLGAALASLRTSLRSALETQDASGAALLQRFYGAGKAPAYIPRLQDATLFATLAWLIAHHLNEWKHEQQMQMAESTEPASDDGITILIDTLLDDPLFSASHAQESPSTVAAAVPLPLLSSERPAETPLRTADAPLQAPVSNAVLAALVLPAQQPQPAPAVWTVKQILPETPPQPPAIVHDAAVVLAALQATSETVQAPVPLAHFPVAQSLNIAPRALSPVLSPVLSPMLSAALGQLGGLDVMVSGPVVSMSSRTAEDLPLLLQTSSLSLTTTLVDGPLVVQLVGSGMVLKDASVTFHSAPV